MIYQKCSLSYSSLYPLALLEHFTCLLGDICMSMESNDDHSDLLDIHSTSLLRGPACIRGKQIFLLDDIYHSG